MQDYFIYKKQRLRISILKKFDLCGVHSGIELRKFKHTRLEKFAKVCSGSMSCQDVRGVYSLKMMPTHTLVLSDFEDSF